MNPHARRLKLALCCLLAACLFAATLVGVGYRVSAAEPIKVILDGKALQFDVAPVNINDRVLVPMRAIFEALKADIQWNGAAQTVTATRGERVVKVTIDSPIARVDGEATILDVVPILFKDRTMVPLRFVSEALDCTVDWDEKAQTVRITSSGGSDSGNLAVDPTVGDEAHSEVEDGVWNDSLEW